MIAQFLVMAALPVLLAVAAGWDLASFTIPNALTLALAAAFLRLCGWRWVFRPRSSACIFWPA